MQIRQGNGQPIREDGPISHLLTKKGTPSMGGLLILASFFISTIFWSDLPNVYVWIIIVLAFLFGLIGFELLIALSKILILPNFDASPILASSNFDFINIIF